jgi:hypothetical protein
MHKYRFTWMNGFTTEVTGVTPRDAFGKLMSHSLKDVLKFEEVKSWK